MVIAIDGPAGSGKSTVARKLANRLAFLHLNSGALFRAVGLFAKEQQLSLDDDAAVAGVARSMRFRFELKENGESRFYVNEEEIASRLAQEEVGALASKVALLPTVRQILLEVQRDTAKTHSLVVEGRDSGTVVFPDAEKKFYLDTSLDVRAKRRLNELQPASGTEGGERGNDAKLLERIREQLEARDRQDATRAIAPHRRASDAVFIDTSSRTPDEVVDEIVRVIGEAGGNAAEQ